MIKFLALSAFLFAGSINAKILSKDVRYKVGETFYKSTIVYSDKVQKSAPLIVMVPNWKGMTEESLKKAKLVAGDKYIVMMADMYGEDVRPKNNNEAKKASSAMKSNIPKLRRVMNKSVDILKEEGKKLNGDDNKIAAIGFCFGGSAVLESARSGKDLKAVVTFHGNLLTPNLEDAKNIKGKILVLHGAIDPVVPKKELESFEKEMNNANVDWQLVSFSGAVHSFTNPTANREGASKYHPLVTKRSFIMMDNFFDEVFKN
ncbi:dienelactone hydrolase family protein [Halobacteriovorax sp.]|uniref:dienelactone hydrolase family protein n=1 Tax=Halobacteriovorax sp. TaxID=2020862 RepID=UPI0035654693